jgi:hypothetical protein
MCFVRTSRQAEIISVHSNKWLDLQSIARDYIALIHNLYIRLCTLISKDDRVMTEAGRFRCLTEEARVRFEVSPSWNCGGQGGTRTGFYSGTSFPF